MGVGPEDPGLDPGNEPEDQVCRSATEAQGEGLASGACQLIQPQDMSQRASLHSQDLSIL